MAAAVAGSLARSVAQGLSGRKQIELGNVKHSQMVECLEPFTAI
jgi:hypothetical protein